MGWTRRDLLRDSLLLAAGAPLLAAAGPSDLRIGQIKTNANWNPRPSALRRLLWEVSQRTSIEVDLETVALEPHDPKIFRHPLLYWGGSGGFAPLSDEAVRMLRRHLTYGGMLLADSADADPGGAFDTSMRRELRRIFPRNDLAQLPNEHVIYKSFYLVDHQAGRTIRTPYIEGVLLEKRWAVVYAQNDLAGAWARDSFGRWEYEVTPGGEHQREMAYRLGINIVMYALCLDYKDDLVHAPFILKRRN
jgi:hypothetical protein